ncbi:hypothetical protein ACJJTC_011362 [Scirpophaga incertulas]
MTILDSFIFIVVLICLTESKNVLPRTNPIVSTNLGTIEGLFADDGDYSMFLGIPYAKVNASNPFGVATPQKPFEGIFKAHDDSVICPQLEEFNYTISGTIDCLHINVYVPNHVDQDYPLPVMVWIYGGGFSGGFAGRYAHGPKWIVRHNVILVTFNYRLGPYGFMCLDTPEVPGNQGLKDQLLALRWIKNNIAAFGGDSDKITAFGESAGGISVDYHIISPHEKLFHAAIIQSGTAMISGFPLPQRDAPQILAAFLGYETDDMHKALSFLTSESIESVISTALILGISFTPCIEKQYEGVESFMTESWSEQTVVPKAENMPIIIGYNNYELHFAYIDHPQSFYDKLNIFHDRLMRSFDINNEKFDGMKDLVQQFYIGNKEITVSNGYDIGDFDSDMSFVYPTHRSIYRFLDNNVGDIYNYVFSYSGNRNFLQRKLNITMDGAIHADEVSYLFDNAVFTETPTAADQMAIDRFTTMWTNFAKYGNPVPEPTTLLPVKWTPITKQSPSHYLEINAELAAENTRPFNRRLTFLDLFYKSNEKLMIKYSQN